MSEEIVREIEMARLAREEGRVEVGSTSKRPHVPAGRDASFGLLERAAKSLGLSYKSESTRFIVYRPDHCDDMAFMYCYPDVMNGSVHGGSDLERIEENMALLRMFRAEVQIIKHPPPSGWVAKGEHYENASASCAIPRGLDRVGRDALRQLLEWMESARGDEGSVLRGMARSMALADMPDLKDAEDAVKYRQGKAGR